MSLKNTILSTLIILLGFSFQADQPNPVTKETVERAEAIMGLRFSDAERDSLLGELKEQLESYESLRTIELSNTVSPALQFNPIPAGFIFEKKRKPFAMSPVRLIKRPANLEDAAFWPVRHLAELVRTKQVTSEELTIMYLGRLKKYGPKLECVVTLTESLAIAQARRADREIKAGKYRGPLHGIPYGAKDLLSVRSYRTTWGSVPYKEQVIDRDATVIKKLEAAGAVLVAKLTLGELAWGDVWFGGLTRNPWNYKQGSSGSSAGSASATAAGLVGFGIGSETYGSIVSPSTRCGTTGLRPTFGRVSRAGAMALSWSMDKLGPICRAVEDCAIVLNAIAGADGLDQTVLDVPFNYSPGVRLSDMRIGFLKMEFDSARSNKERNDEVLNVLRKLGANLVPVELSRQYPINSIAFILSAEAGAAFDELTRSGKDDLLVRQIKNAWPNVFRASRFIPAVEYVQANRIRSLVIQDMQRLFQTIDVYVAPSFGGDNLLRTNLTGHPCVVLPHGFTKEGTPTSISFIGQLYDEGRMLAVAKAYQDATEWHLKHPKLEE